MLGSMLGDVLGIPTAEKTFPSKISTIYHTLYMCGQWVASLHPK